MRGIIIQCLLFNKIIIPLTLVAYELLSSAPRPLSKSSYPTRVRGITDKCSGLMCQFCIMQDFMETSIKGLN